MSCPRGISPPDEMLAQRRFELVLLAPSQLDVPFVVRAVEMKGVGGWQGQSGANQVRRWGKLEVADVSWRWIAGWSSDGPDGLGARAGDPGPRSPVARFLREAVRQRICPATRKLGLRRFDPATRGCDRMTRALQLRHISTPRTDEGTKVPSTTRRSESPGWPAARA